MSKFRDLHGIVLLDKPLGMSSNQALQAVRRIFRAAKGGHTGALDPLATGLLPLCFGEATKIAGSLLGSRKAYVADCRLGVTTATADLEGEVLQTRPVPDFADEGIERALAPLRGCIMQVPPIYSALKQGGEPLYVKARRGEAVDVPPREVEIFRLDVLARTADTVKLYVECGSGTYVRSLAVDLGEGLGCGAHLIGLRRLWVEPFREPVNMLTIDQLAQAREQGDDALLAHLLPLAAGLTDWPALHLDAGDSLAVSQGRQIQVPEGVPGRCVAYADDGRPLALGEIDGEGKLRIQRGFNLPKGGGDLSGAVA